MLICIDKSLFYNDIRTCVDIINNRILDTLINNGANLLCDACANDHVL